MSLADKLARWGRIVSGGSSAEEPLGEPCAVRAAGRGLVWIGSFEIVAFDPPCARAAEEPNAWIACGGQALAGAIWDGRHFARFDFASAPPRSFGALVRAAEGALALLKMSEEVVHAATWSPSDDAIELLRGAVAADNSAPLRAALAAFSDPRCAWPLAATILALDEVALEQPIARAALQHLEEIAGSWGDWIDTAPRVARSAIPTPAEEAPPASEKRPKRRSRRSLVTAENPLGLHARETWI